MVYTLLKDDMARWRNPCVTVADEDARGGEDKGKRRRGAWDAFIADVVSIASHEDGRNSCLKIIRFCEHLQTPVIQCRSRLALRQVLCTTETASFPSVTKVKYFSTVPSLLFSLQLTLLHSRVKFFIHQPFNYFSTSNEEWPQIPVICTCGWPQICTCRWPCRWQGLPRANKFASRLARRRETQTTADGKSSKKEDERHEGSKRSDVCTGAVRCTRAYRRYRQN